MWKIILQMIFHRYKKALCNFTIPCLNISAVVDFIECISQTMETNIIS